MKFEKKIWLHEAPLNFQNNKESGDQSFFDFSLLAWKSQSSKSTNFLGAPLSIKAFYGGGHDRANLQFA